MKKFNETIYFRVIAALFIVIISLIYTEYRNQNRYQFSPLLKGVILDTKTGDVYSLEGKEFKKYSIKKSDED